MDDSSSDEFLADFGDSLALAEVNAFLENARVRGDRDARLLAKQYLALRATAQEVITAIDAETSFSEGQLGELLRYMRFLVTDSAGQR